MSTAPAVLFNLVTAIVSGCLSGLTGLLLYRMNRRLDSKPNDKVNNIQKKRKRDNLTNKQYRTRLGTFTNTLCGL